MSDTKEYICCHSICKNGKDPDGKSNTNPKEQTVGHLLYGTKGGGTDYKGT